MTKNKNYKRKSKNNKNKIRRRRINRTPFKSYKYIIKTAIVSYITPEYTEKNLSFNVYDLLRNTNVFLQLKPQFSQYKLDRVTFIGIPRTVGGTDPSPIWIYLDTDGTQGEFNYVAIQELQGSRSLPVKYTSFTRFSNTGRQDDFHYWYDVNGFEKNTSYMTIRLHSEATPNSTKFWQFQLEFTVHFRGFIVEPSNNSKKLKQGEQSIREMTYNGEGEAEGNEVVSEMLCPDDENNN